MVGGPIVAIDAVHGANFVFLRIFFEVGGAIFSGDTIATGEPDPWDHLAFLVGGNVLDLVAQIHVPVNAADGPMRGRAAADFEQKSHAEFGVRLVGEEMRVRTIEIADVLLRPMTLFAGFLGRAEVLDRSGDRLLDLARERAIELMDAVDLRFDVRPSARADVAIDAGDARMGRILIGNVFGLHGRVAGLTAELRRFRVVIRAVAPDGSNQQE